MKSPSGRPSWQKIADGTRQPDDVTPASTSVVKGQSTTLTVAFQPEGATDKSFRAVSADKTKVTVSVSGMTITVKGVAAGKVNIPVVSGNGELAVVAEITVTDS
ncbi:major tail protein V [Escherichia coli p0305293.12]|nr:major tail protein V [Escherichia coli p0305293.12]